ALCSRELSAMELTAGLSRSHRAPQSRSQSDRYARRRGCARASARSRPGARTRRIMGPFARRAFFLLAGPDGVDTETTPVPWRTLSPRKDIAGLRIVWRSSWPDVSTARTVTAAVERVARELAGAGGHVEEGDPVLRASN